MNGIPPAGVAAQKYIRIFNELGVLGKHGFALMLDTASPGELAELLRAADVLQAQIDRTKPLL
jgi:hypothetical protein